MNQTTVESIDREQWTTLIQRFCDYNYRQEWAYSKALAERRRATSLNVAIRRYNELIGLANVRVKNAPLGLGGLAYVSWGLIVHQDDSDIHTNFILF